jgi:hypothetical protein
MYGNPHLEDLLQKYVSENADCSELIQYLRGSLVAFTGPNWEQEDDVTIVTINRLPTAESGYSFVI